MTSSPDPVDVFVGSRVRLRRTLLGMSQEKLGQALGLTFQQIQKYERGANRIGSSRLYRLSRILDVPVSFFFEDMPNDVLKAVTGLEDSAEQRFANEYLSRRETVELLRAYYGIGNAAIRTKLLELVKSVSMDEAD